jgi:lipoprotein NlpD
MRLNAHSMPKLMSRVLSLLFVASLLVLASGCSTPRTKPANVTDRTSGSSEESAPPGYYRVKKGDTLARIAIDHGQSPKDVIAWNNLSNPNQIEVGDLILIKPPAGSKPVAKPIPKPAVMSTANDAPTPKANEGIKANAAPEAVVAEPGIRLSSPAKGAVTGTYSEANKGIDIAGKLGDPVLAASGGKVVYAGNSLRGYGNLVIVKHDNTYLTAYAHNSKLLVKEGDTVTKGQKIAEMGDTDANAVKLHFELRVNGKPVNPQPYLQQ